MIWTRPNEQKRLSALASGLIENHGLVEGRLRMLGGPSRDRGGGNPIGISPRYEQRLHLADGRVTKQWREIATSDSYSSPRCLR